MKSYESEENIKYSKGKPFGAWIGNLGRYNEGILQGEWVRFPVSRKEMDEALKRIGIGLMDDFGNVYEETFIADYDWYLPINNSLGEWESFDELNYLAQRIEDMNEFEFDSFCAAADSGADVSSAKDLINLTYNLDCYNLYEDISTDEELGRYYFDEFYDNKEALGPMEKYIDYQSYGRDCRLSEGGTFTEYGYIVNMGGQKEIYNGNRDEIPDEYRMKPEAETVKGKLLEEARRQVMEQGKPNRTMTEEQAL